MLPSDQTCSKFCMKMLIAEQEQITLQTESSARVRRDIVNDMQPPVLHVQQCRQLCCRQRRVDWGVVSCIRRGRERRRGGRQGMCWGERGERLKASVEVRVNDESLCCRITCLYDVEMKWRWREPMARDRHSWSESQNRHISFLLNASAALLLLAM